MEPNFIARPLDLADRDDPYSSIKQDFGKIFYDQNLNNFANPSDLGFSDFSKTYYDQYPSHSEDHPKTHEPENTHNVRVPIPREDLANYQMNAATYNSLGLPHHNSGHYNPNHNTNFGFNGVKQQPFQQEHLGYPGYHPHHHQQYYYQNQHHYDGQGPQQQPNHGNNAEYYQHPRDVGDNHHVDDSLSMMWRNEPGKGMNYKNMQMNGLYNGDLNKVKGNQGFASYEQPGEGRTYPNMNDYDARRNQMMRMQQEMSMASTRKGMEPQQKGFNPMMPSANGMDLKVPVNKGNLGMMKYAAKVSPKKGSTNAKLDLDDEEDDGDDGYGDDKGRSTRGLRVLSLKVKDIVMQKKRTSYKEVAETLTHELRQKSSGKPLKEESKDEQNVKRRVYDALNVLIAAGVLRKEGKVVYCDNPMAGSDPSMAKRGGGGKEKLLKDIEEAKKRNKAKIELLHELIFKCLAIKNLIKNNKAKLEAEGNPENKPKPRPSSVSATRIEVVQENPALKPKNEDVIRFPFIVLLSSSAENSMNLNMDTQQKQLAIESKKPFNIFGDIDVLLKMGLHYVTRKMFDENIPVELQKFVPKYFLAALN